VSSALTSPSLLSLVLTIVFLSNCNNSAPMPWKKRVLMHMEQTQTECQDEPLAPPVASGHALPASVTAANACELGAVSSSQQNDEYENEALPRSAGGADFTESMVA
jgi:hypothetical protein